MRTLEELIVNSIAILLVTTSCATKARFSSSGSTQPARQTPTVTKPQIPQQTPEPMPTNAIVQGSFTVWADPPHPMQKQSYFIHVRVTLPKNVTTYSRQDLSGTLVGTDGYHQTINDPFMGILTQKFHFIPGSGFAELVMLIPGALQGIDDTLQVKSQILNESQTIFVHFD